MSTTEKTYEMMWDCPFCGQKKLLGLTHRHCPNCGAPQDASKRYFPPDNEKVAVQDHPFVGADLLCPSCQKAMSRNCACCTNCGAPLAGGKEVALKQALPPGGQAFPQGGQGLSTADLASPKKSNVGLWIGLVIAVIIGIVALRSCLKKDAQVAVTRHGWTREIAVERFDEVEERSPCKSMPSDARVKSRSKDAPVCTTKKIDNGDGTFKEKTTCSEPVEQCTYGVYKWHEVRTASATGGPNDDPKWPVTGISRAGDCRGCEREGKRTEAYTVYFEDTATKKELSCDMNSPSKWKSYEVGAKYKAQIHVVGGDLDCGSLQKL